jgi:ribonuclease BN (tRNA processing enzyme)
VCGLTAHVVLAVAVAAAAAACSDSDAPPPAPADTPPIDVAALAGRLVVSAGDAGGDVFALRADGGGRRRLTDHPAAEFDAAWSPDGTRIAFRAHRGAGGNEEVFVMNADGNRERTLTRHRATDYSPAWSPDGRFIAFASDRDDPTGNDVYVIGADGRGLRRLVHRAGIDEYPTWSPDGSRIAWSCTGGRVLPEGVGDFELCVADAEGGAVTQLTDAAGVSQLPDWSPDGRSIAFESDRNGWPTLPGYRPPGWSPDRHGDLEVFVMDADGSNERNATHQPARGRPRARVVAGRALPRLLALRRPPCDPRRRLGDGAADRRRDGHVPRLGRGRRPVIRAVAEYGSGDARPPMTAATPAAVAAYHHALAGRLAGVLGAELVGVYATGSFALGDFDPERSDLDVAAVARGRLDRAGKEAIVAAARHEALPCPARGLELVVYAEAAVREPTAGADFELNLNTGARMPFRADLAPAGEWHWFVIDRSITARHGVALAGPPAHEVFAPVPRRALIDAIAESFRWHRDVAPATSDAVLNACRAVRFAVCDEWSSKPAAGAWMAARDGAPAVVDDALEARRSDAALDRHAVAAFLAAAEQEVRARAGEPRREARPALPSRPKTAYRPRSMFALTVLGGSPAWPNPGQAASGYLVENAETRVLVDCGSGIAAELRAHDPGPLVAIVISHFHADHWFDLVPLHYAYRYGNWRDRPHPRLHLPPGGRAALDTLASVWGGSLETFEAAFDVTEYDPRGDLRIGSLRFRFAPTLHYTPSYAMEIAAHEGTIVYSADTAPTERLVGFARGADLFVCEAALRDAGKDSTERGHMDAAEAGQAAARARVGRLLLTHVPSENGEQEVLEQAARHYDGPTDLARPGLRIEVNQKG